MSKKALISARENIFIAQAMIWTVAVAARADEETDPVCYELVLKHAHRLLTEVTEALGQLEDKWTNSNLSGRNSLTSPQDGLAKQTGSYP
jgi:hypothetical protein